MPKTYDEVAVLREGPLTKIFNPKTLSTFAFTVVVVIAVLLSPFVFETNDAGYFSVKQAAVTGKLTAIIESGTFAQWFGNVTKYKASDVVHMEIDVRFNDGAKAKVPVNVRYELPASPDKLLDIHQKFRSHQALVQQTIEPLVSEAIRLSAALMSTEESYTTKKAEFSQKAEDQAIHGVYLTEAKEEATKDAKTGEVIRRQTVVIETDKDGKERRKAAPLADYGIKLTQFVITGDPDYDDKVDEMIRAKQEAMQQTVSAKANAERAVQDRLTAEEVGRKNVAVAKYAQEVKKQEAVTQAEQELEVAKLRRQAASLEKDAKILQAEGESEYRRKIMVADGALDKKLATYEKVMLGFADAMAKTQQPLVPSIVNGGASGGGSNAALGLLEVIATKAGRDLALDMKAKGQ